MSNDSSWQYRKSKAKREFESMTMLRDILNAPTLKEKRDAVALRNPMFYLMFHEGVANKSVYPTAEEIEWTALHKEQIRRRGF